MLDRVVRIYGSRTRYSIYNNEYGYITNPPNHSSSHFVSPATAATYINWAEYLSWRNSRIASTMQYLLWDPNPTVNVPEFGGFASGLVFYGGAPKPGLRRLPPAAVPAGHLDASRALSLEVWGGVRPAHYASLDTHGTPQQVQIQFQRGSSGAFTTLRTVTDHELARLLRPAPDVPRERHGQARVVVSDERPVAHAEPCSSPGSADTVYSRTVKVTVKRWRTSAVSRALDSSAVAAGRPAGSGRASTAQALASHRPDLDLPGRSPARGGPGRDAGPDAPARGPGRARVGAVVIIAPDIIGPLAAGLQRLRPGGLPVRQLGAVGRDRGRRPARRIPSTSI